MVLGVFVKPYSKSFTLNEAWITTHSVRRVCFGLAKPSILHAGLFGREVSELLHVETHSWSAWGDTDGRATVALSVHELLPQSFHTTLPLVPILLLFNPLSPCWISWLLSALFHSAMSVKSWLEGYNLRETWDPITDTNILSLQAALSPLVSHILASAAGLCLPGTRQPTCLSRHISFFTV